MHDPSIHSSWLRYRSVLSNPLVLVQCILVGVAFLWLFIASFRQWHFASPPTGWTIENYLRIVRGGTVRDAFLTTFGLAFISAAIAVAIAGSASLFAIASPKRGHAILALLIVPSIAATPIRGEAWRNLAGIFKIDDLSWVAVPAMVSSAVPIAALIFYLGTRDLQIRDLTLGRISGIPAARRTGGLWGSVLVQAILAAWLFSAFVILFDLETASALYRGARYLLADELRSRMGVQAWSHLAADATVIALIGIVLISASSRLVSNRLRSRYRLIDREERTSARHLGLLIVPFALVYLPLFGLVVGSFSSSELVVSLETVGTLRWWEEAWSNDRLGDATLRSAIESIVALGIAIPLGAWAAVSAWRRDLRNDSPGPGLYVFWFLPWLLHPTALAIAIGLIMQRLGLSPDIRITAVYHSLWVAPIIATLCRVRLNRVSRHDVSLARTFGIGSRAWMTRLIGKELIGGALLGSVVALGIIWTEALLADLTTGVEETLPVMLRGMTRSGGTPVIDVVGVVVMTSALTIVILAWWTATRSFVVKREVAWP